ncbi:hypothetical protein [Flavobacterium sp.]
MNLFKLFFKKSKLVKDSTEVTSKNYINHEWDEVHDVWTSNDLAKMLKVTNLKTSLINRHFLLQTIVNESYKLRDEEHYKNQCLKYSEIHLDEFNEIAPALKEDFNEILPRITTFQNYATILTEIGDYEKAISVCETAISCNLSDGTKSNYQGRIDRIKKKHDLI